MSAVTREFVDAWLADGVITADQATRMRADLDAVTATGPAPTGLSAMVAEALGYLGGVIVVIALGLLLNQFWEDLASLGRLLVVAGMAAGLLWGGALIPARRSASGRRLRAVLWLAGTAAVAFLGNLLAERAGLRDANAGLVAATGAALVGAGLWKLSGHLLQHASVVVATSVAITLAVGTWLGWEQAPWQPGAAVCAFGILWATLAHLGRVRDRYAGLLFGMGVSIVGIMSTMGERVGAVLAVLLVVGWVAVALARKDLIILAGASMATLIVVPNAMTLFFPGEATAAFALLVVGALLLTAAVVMARRRAAGPPTPRPL